MNEKNKGRLEFVFASVGLLGALATIPQVIKVWTAHPEHLQSLSFITWSSYGLIAVIGIAYGIVFKRKAIVITNSAYLVLYTLILAGLLIEAQSLW